MERGTHHNLDQQISGRVEERMNEGWNLLKPIQPGAHQASSICELNKLAVGSE